MKITFIGTGAGEAYPGFWCECPNCSYAREKKGRNIRGNTCTMIDDDTMIDMNAHFYEAAPHMGIRMSRIELLLVTHAHADHLTPHLIGQRHMDLSFRSMPLSEQMKCLSPNFTILPTLHIYGNRFTKMALDKAEGRLKDYDACNIVFHEIADGKQEKFKDITFLPVRSRHGDPDGYTHSFIIERDGKTLLYASDSGGYDDDMLEIVLRRKYDCVIMEGTFGYGVRIDKHMNLEKNIEMRDLFDRHHVWKNGPNMYLTHICPHWAPPHDLYEPIIENEGMHLAYDGKVIEI